MAATILIADDDSIPRRLLHAVNGKTYWEMFAVCFTSANAVLYQGGVPVFADVRADIQHDRPGLDRMKASAPIIDPNTVG